MFLRSAEAPPAGEESREAYRFIGEPPEKLVSSGLAPPAIIVLSAPSGEDPVFAGDPSPWSFIDASNRSFIGNGDRGAAVTPCASCAWP